MVGGQKWNVNVQKNVESSGDLNKNQDSKNIKNQKMREQQK